MRVPLCDTAEHVVSIRCKCNVGLSLSMLGSSSYESLEAGITRTEEILPTCRGGGAFI